MSLAFERPAWLLLLAFAPAIFWVASRSLADVARAQHVLQAIARTFVLGAVALALAGPSLRRPSDAVSVVVLVDVSDSQSAASLDRARAEVAALRVAAEASRARVRVVRFAARPEEITTRTLSPLPAPAGRQTDLALAVGLGAGLLDDGALPRLLMISDGEATRGDLRAAAERLAARGIPLFALATPASETGDIAVESLDAGDDLRPGAPFPVEVRLVADRAAHVRVRLDGAGVTVDAPERTVDVAPGSTSVSFVARLLDTPATDAPRLHARVLPDAPDRHPDNDEGVLALSSARPPRVLAIEGTPSSAAPFARALQAERIAVDVRLPRALPTRPALDRYDLVVLSNVARAAVSDKQLAALDAFVHDGGGLLVAGGADAFGSGGWRDSRLAPLLPVLLDLPERDDEASLALALVIDKSGSMAGPKLELTKEAARATVDLMPPADLIGVVTFDAQATPVVRLQRASNRARIVSDISRIRASGGTNILLGLREGFDELAPARARKKHIILLSDGASPPEGIADLVDAAMGKRITISTVGVGDGADNALLKSIATRGGGRFYQTRDPASLPRIFSRETSEVNRGSIVEESTVAKVVKRADLFAGVALDGAPPLGGYTVTRPRPRAELLLAAPNGAPLLARWQVGLGQVVAWTSDVEPRWSAAWMRWPAFPKFWGQVTRATMRRRAPNHFPVRASRDGERVALIIDAAGTDDRFLVGLDGTVDVTAVSPAGAASPRRRLALAETAPGHYEAAFDADAAAGALLFQASLADADGAPVADATGHLSLPLAPELRPSVPDLGDDNDSLRGAALLAAVATRTGGRVVPHATDILSDVDVGPRPDTRRPLRTPVLLVALALFGFDVFLRRVRLDALPRLRRGKV